MPYPAQPCRAEAGTLPRQTGHHGRVPEVDHDQLAALRRLRAAFGFIQIVEVISHDPEDPTEPPGEPIEGARMVDPASDDS